MRDKKDFFHVHSTEELVGERRMTFFSQLYSSVGPTITVLTFEQSELRKELLLKLRKLAVFYGVYSLLHVSSLKKARVCSRGQSD
jgi:hypothetical protein